MNKIRTIIWKDEEIVGKDTNIHESLDDLIVKLGLQNFIKINTPIVGIQLFVKKILDYRVYVIINI